MKLALRPVIGIMDRRDLDAARAADARARRSDRWSRDRTRPPAGWQRRDRTRMQTSVPLGRGPSRPIYAGLRNPADGGEVPFRAAGRSRPSALRRWRTPLGTRPLMKDSARVSAIDVCLPQLFYRSLGTDRRVVHLFKRVRPRLGAQDRQDLDVPVVVVVNRLPVAQILGGMAAAR